MAESVRADGALPTSAHRRRDRLGLRPGRFATVACAFVPRTIDDVLPPDVRRMTRQRPAALALLVLLLGCAGAPVDGPSGGRGGADAGGSGGGSGGQTTGGA